MNSHWFVVQADSRPKTSIFYISIALSTAYTLTIEAPTGPDRRITIRAAEQGADGPHLNPRNSPKAHQNMSS
jgi:hypothetical protein